MFLEMSKSLLGEWGTAILDFYLAHQLIINIIIISYGIIMIIFRRKKKRKENVQ